MRNLEREIANLARKAIKEIVSGKADKVTVTRRNLDKYRRRAQATATARPSRRTWSASVTGLAWTEVGGELLTIEAVMLPGKGKMTTTGKLGDVMKESVQAAESFVKARAISFGIKPPIFEKRDIHVHVPEGATPEGRPVGRRRHGHVDRLGADRHPGARRRRHDRRDHAARPRAADRRPQGEAARGAARRASRRC